MANLKIEAEQAMNVLEVNESDRAILQKRLRGCSEEEKGNENRKS